MVLPYIPPAHLRTIHGTLIHCGTVVKNHFKKITFIFSTGKNFTYIVIGINLASSMIGEGIVIMHSLFVRKSYNSAHN